MSAWVNAAHLDYTKKTTTGGVLTTIVDGALDDSSPWPYIAVGGGVLLVLGVTALIVSSRKSGRAARSFGEFDAV